MGGYVMRHEFLFMRERATGSRYAVHIAGGTIVGAAEPTHPDPYDCIEWSTVRGSLGLAAMLRVTEIQSECCPPGVDKCEGA